MIFLDKDKVESAAGYNSWVDAIEKTFRLSRDKDYLMPIRSHIDFGNNTLLLMPCIGADYFATKLVSVFPENANKGISPIYGTVVLNSAVSGEPLAIIDGTALTALRTAAVGSFGIRHLAPGGVSSLGVFGIGKQGTYQSLIACSQRDFKKIYVYDSNYTNFKLFREILLNEYPHLQIIQAKSNIDLCEKSEVIITATNSKIPVLPDKETILKGKTVIGIGSYKPDMREFPEALYKLIDRIYIDTEDGIRESGDLMYPLSQGWLVKDQFVPGSEIIGLDIPEETTRVFKSVGMAIFDLAAAILVYEANI